MKKQLLLISSLTIFLVNAQNNDALKKEFERQNKENTQRFDSFITKQYGSREKTPEVQKEIEEKRSRLGGFLPDGKPFFLQTHDMDQIKNSNSDFLQNGTVNGLTGTFNGENIKFTIFDGGDIANSGRVFADHAFFNNLPNRVSNKEASTMNYGGHATSVAGFIGARPHIQSVTFSNGSTRTINFQGIAKNSTIDSYAFLTTTLPGDTSSSTVFQKILTAQPKISNHSYGTNPGWDLRNINGANSWLWNGSFTSPATSYDVQGTYYTSDQNYDQIVYTNPSYIIVKSAGNSYGFGPTYPGTSAFLKYYTNNNTPVQFAATDTLPSSNCALGYDCIGIGSLAKNIIVVGATDIITTNDGRYMASADVIHSSYSSAGPRDDGGIKPDITAVGTAVGSAVTAENLTGSQGIMVNSGTSFSGPVVTGIIGLWTQINKQLFGGAELNAASAKTLMIHSALEAGNIGPDPHFGWGFIDAKKGAELLVGKSNNSILFNDETLTSGTPNKKRVIASGSEPLKVTISWIDPAYAVPANLTYEAAHNDRNSKLVNDLDLRIIDTTTNMAYEPWKLNALSPMTPATKGDNTVDNVEQVIIPTPVAGREYRIEITNKGSLVNGTGANAPQNYSILTSGYTQVLSTGEATRQQDDIAVVPAVTKDIVTLLKAPKKSIYTVYDMSGKKLQNGIIHNDRESLDLSSYAKGIYIIEIKNDKIHISKKVIKD
ncbi:Por secretion system C-terminal sorting domain-containing protein [Chryseobacterium oleae]|uniref:Por secretion system C-terminal sorting domain-containing protein n=1 Tax=Chryseobacterium oleae TaxID=491207 RepID=A0A1I5BYD2_CHROL|nr:S8 family peptidase [Chryseobacterium oleae]SFN79713.1 Por secretion system C-terminal sorting domain-containing protein [Chryseobacterium oleae]